MELTRDKLRQVATTQLQQPFKIQKASQLRVWRYSRLEEECCDWLAAPSQSGDRKVLYRLHSLIRRVAIDYLPKIEQEVLPLI